MVITIKQFLIKYTFRLIGYKSNPNLFGSFFQHFEWLDSKNQLIVNW